MAHFFKKTIHTHLPISSCVCLPTQSKQFSRSTVDGSTVLLYGLDGLARESDYDYTDCHVTFTCTNKISGQLLLRLPLRHGRRRTRILPDRKQPRRPQRSGTNTIKHFCAITDASENHRKIWSTIYLYEFSQMILCTIIWCKFIEVKTH